MVPNYLKHLIKPLTSALTKNKILIRFLSTTFEFDKKACLLREDEKIMKTIFHYSDSNILNYNWNIKGIACHLSDKKVFLRTV